MSGIVPDCYLIVGQTFGVRTCKSAQFDFTRLVPILEDVYERLSGVVIENLNYAECINRYDKPNTLFFLDLPYWGVEGSYGKALFNRDEFEQIAARLADIKGQFILSMNDTPETRKVFAGFHVEPVRVTYSLSQKVETKAAELIISNR